MHIIFVFENFALGGVERVSEQLITGLKTLHNCQISIICEQQHGELASRFNTLATIHSLNGCNKFTLFKKLCTMLAPDFVVFTKGGLSKYNLLLPSNIKTVAVQHVPINLPEAGKLKNLLRRIGATILYPRLNHVVCVSKGILNNLTKLNVVNSTNASCIYNPVLDSSLKNLANTDVEYQDYFVSVGRLHYQKGYDLLISAIAKAKKTLPAIKVVIIGSGPEHNALQQLIHTYKLTDNVILHGATNNPYKYIAKAKGILLSSRWEGLPTVLVEAAYLKTPMVAFDCRYGPKELTNNGASGYLVDFFDIDSFSQKIILLNNAKIPLKSPAVEQFFLPAATSHYYTLFKSLL